MDDEHHSQAGASLSDDIDSVEITTDSARRVQELLKQSGRTYADGELNHVERAKVLTGSEIPTICGENRFETPSAAFFKKAFDVHFAGNAATEHGKHYEPIAIAKFKAQSGAKVFFVGFMLHRTFRFIGGTFDALAILPTGEGVLVEVKCPYTRGIGTTIPEHYIGQVQAYMEVAGLDRCLFVQYKPPYVTPTRGMHRPEKLSVVSVPRDAGYFASRMPALWRFFKRLCAFREGVLPTANAAATVLQRVWRHHRNAWIRMENDPASDMPRMRNASVTRLMVRLAAAEYGRQRRMYDGVSEAVDAELEHSQKPEMPTKPVPDGTVVIVVPIERSGGIITRRQPDNQTLETICVSCESPRKTRKISDN